MCINRVLFILGFFLTLLSGCSSEPDEMSLFGFSKPEHFPDPTYTFVNNPVTLEGFNLGKRIFNDPILSQDGTVACANCHDQRAAFADPQHRLSIGVYGRIGIRNAPAIQNLAFSKNFFWDGGVVHVDFIPTNAITNPLEMDESLANVIQKLNEHPDYPDLFQQVFGTDTITSPRMLHALSQFLVMMVSAESTYDKYVLGESKLTSTELEGLQLFEEKCSTCHSGVLFTDGSFRNNGLDSEFIDIGRSKITELESDLGKFRVPSLRNVALTKPYMHDGRLRTLENVLDHYDDRVLASATLDPILTSNETRGIPMTDEEKSKIIQFLHTLTDENFISNPLFFRR